VCAHLLCICNFRVTLHLAGQTTWNSVTSALVIYIFCATIFKFNFMLYKIISVIQFCGISLVSKCRWHVVRSENVCTRHEGAW